MKLGFDVHGVLDTSPEFFAELTKLLVDSGHEVHILTGARIGQTVKDLLAEHSISYTHLFSITDYQIEKGTEIEWDEKGNPHMDAYLWDKSKAEYCEKHGIQLHIDDSDSYGYFFKTPYSRFFSRNTKRVRKTII